MTGSAPLRSHAVLLGLARRAALVIFVLTLVFFLFSVLPADPVRSLLGVNATEDAIAALREDLGLDSAVHVRFAKYLWGVVQFDLGRSYVTMRPVGPAVLAALRATLLYVSGALALALFYSLIAATIFHFGAPPVRRVIRGVNSIFTSVPSLVVAVGIGVALLVTGFWPLLVPGDLGRTVGVSIALSVYPGCSMAQILIDGITRLRYAAHVTATRSFGFSERRVFFSTLLRGAMLPWLAQLSNAAAGLVAGAVVVEVVFSMPGLGRLVLQSVLRSDLAMIQGVVLVTAVSFLILDGFVEVAYRRFFPAANV